MRVAWHEPGGGRHNSLVFPQPNEPQKQVATEQLFTVSGSEESLASLRTHSMSDDSLSKLSLSSADSCNGGLDSGPTEVCLAPCSASRDALRGGVQPPGLAGARRPHPRRWAPRVRAAGHAPACRRRRGAQPRAVMCWCGFCADVTLPGMQADGGAQLQSSRSNITTSSGRPLAS